MSTRVLLTQVEHLFYDIRMVTIPMINHAGVDSARAGRDDSPSLLSPRLLEVLILSSRGMTQVDISNELGISKQTVRHHRSKIIHVLGARNMVEAALKARDQNII